MKIKLYFLLSVLVVGLIAFWAGQRVQRFTDLTMIAHRGGQACFEAIVGE